MFKWTKENEAELLRLLHVVMTKYEKTMKTQKEKRKWILTKLRADPRLQCMDLTDDD